MIEFDDLELLLAQAVTFEAPRPEVKERLMARIRAEAEVAAPGGASAASHEAADTAAPPELPAGFSFTWAHDGWQPHPVPGIQMKVLALNRERAVMPRTRFEKRPLIT